MMIVDDTELDKFNIDDYTVLPFPKKINNNRLEDDTINESTKSYSLIYSKTVTDNLPLIST